MIIRGNTVGTTMPRSDYAQTDPKAADYIKNKPDAAIQRAQKCADQAQETANLALEAVDAAKAEAKSYTDESVRKAAPRNLLDNSDFRNPVSQRGVFVAENYECGIDRWLGTYSATSGALTLKGQGIAVQEVENASSLVGKTLTFAVKIGHEIFCGAKIMAPESSDTIFISKTGFILLYNSYFKGFEIANTGSTEITVAWAALYEGEYTAETLPEYQPKGYMVEALNCGALHVTTTATLPASGWTDWGYNRYGQSITVSGVLESDFPHITTNDLSGNWVTVKDEYSKIGISWATSNTIHFVCNGEYPTVDIPIQIEVNR